MRGARSARTSWSRKKAVRAYMAIKITIGRRHSIIPVISSNTHAISQSPLQSNCSTPVNSEFRKEAIFEKKNKFDGPSPLYIYLV